MYLRQLGERCVSSDVQRALDGLYETRVAFLTMSVSLEARVFDVDGFETRLELWLVRITDAGEKLAVKLSSRFTSEPPFAVIPAMLAQACRQLSFLHDVAGVIEHE